jgi:dihydrofolate synthase / folylpolyglutamate synthase
MPVNFEDAQAYLYSLGNEVSAMKLGLENIRKLLDALDNPQNRYLKVQVAGTNGKGSVCAFVESICQHAGINTGVFTSPHLVSITERIKVDGEPIDEERFARLATQVRRVSEEMLAGGALEYLPTFFEQITAIALLAFAEANVSLAILETGLGGRLDATTAANAEIAVLTRISMDHQEYLGNTIEEIAAEKAAIIRPDSTVIAGRQAHAVEKTIYKRCLEVGVEPHWATTEILTIKHEGDVLASTFMTPQSTYPTIELGLEGRHQIENAAVAIAIVEELKDRDLDITDHEICLGLETVEHPGRLEYLNGYMLDGAHNVEGVRALRDYLDEFFPGRSLTIIFGAMKGKDVAEMAASLFPHAENLILTRPDNSRSMTAEELAAAVPVGFDGANAILTNSVSEALNLANEVRDDSIVLITGSLYLVGEAKKILNN